jgi:hypothetical protein
VVQGLAILIIKTDFVVFSAEGAENNKIGFIMRIAAQGQPYKKGGALP